MSKRVAVFLVVLFTLAAQAVLLRANAVIFFSMQPATDSRLNDNTPFIGGTTDPAWGQLNMTLSSCGATQTFTNIPITNGASWSVTPQALAEGYCDAHVTQGTTIDHHRRFHIDTSAPAVTLTSPAAGSTTTSSLIFVAGTGGRAVGDVASVRVNIYSGPTASGSPVTFVDSSVAANGSYSGTVAVGNGVFTARAQQRDQAQPSPGNIGFSNTRTFTVDSTGPVVTIDSTPPKRTKKRNGTFEFSSPESPVTFSCDLDGKGFADCDSGIITYRVRAGRRHTFTVVGSDSLGNATQVSYSWKVLRRR